MNPNAINVSLTPEIVPLDANRVWWKALATAAAGVGRGEDPNPVEATRHALADLARRTNPTSALVAPSETVPLNDDTVDRLAKAVVDRVSEYIAAPRATVTTVPHHTTEPKPKRKAKDGGLARRLRKGGRR